MTSLTSTDLEYRYEQELKFVFCNFYKVKAYKILGLLRRTVHNTRIIVSMQTKRVLYLSLVRSKLLYCSPVWRPQCIKDIRDLESVQRRATKFILDDCSSDYKLHLTRLNLLPLMMQLEVMFFVKNLEDPSQSFNVN